MSTGFKRHIQLAKKSIEYNIKGDSHQGCCEINSHDKYAMSCSTRSTFKYIAYNNGAETQVRG